MTNISRRYLTKLLGLIITFLSFSHLAFATTFSTPPSGNDLLGEVQVSSPSSGESLITMGARYDVGFDQMAHANPDLDPTASLSSGTTVVVPSQFLLPRVRNGIVINLPEMRMYYFINGEVKTYPIGIGKVGKTIPIVNTAVLRKKVNPEWIPPADIREFNRAQGIELPGVMPPGPDNPLGPYAIYLRVPTYLIHSTIFPESIGRRASFGCIRMHESDIRDFFPIVEPGTPVTIIDMPTKVGWQGNRLYLEAHVPLEERNNIYASTAGIRSLVDESVPHSQPILVDWQLVAYLSDERDGMPHEVAFVAN